MTITARQLEQWEDEVDELRTLITDRYRRIEALTKALRELVEACTPLQLPSDRPLTYGVRMPEREVVDAGRTALASAAGAEGEV